ncbi:hypothetical protein Droror1_Dr00021593 [Drosera rotundifolia]
MLLMRLSGKMPSLLLRGFSLTVQLLQGLIYCSTWLETTILLPCLCFPLKVGLIKCMNPNYTEFKFPQFKAHPWHKIFPKRMPPEAVDLVSRLLQYSPNLRYSALDARVHSFFDDLHDPNTRLPSGRYLPPLFNFKPHELKGVPVEMLVKLIPAHTKRQCPSLSL